MDLTDKRRQIMAMLVMLAEYLQTKLSDDQIRLYADDLVEIGPEGVATAIKRLKADPGVWAGRFPLPAKLKAYVRGNIEDMAVESAGRIMACKNFNDLAELSPQEREVAKRYGQKTIMERESGDAQTMFAQLRDMMRVSYNREFIYGPRKAQIASRAPGEQDRLRQEGAGTLRELRDQGSPGEDPEPCA